MLRSRDTVRLAKRLFHAKPRRSAFSGSVANPRSQPDIQHQIPAYQIRLESEFECAVCQYARTTRRGRGVLVLASAPVDGLRRTITDCSPTGTMTSVAPACFAARMIRATSAWVMAAGRRLMTRLPAQSR